MPILMRTHKVFLLVFKVEHKVKQIKSNPKSLQAISIAILLWKEVQVETKATLLQA